MRRGKPHLPVLLFSRPLQGEANIGGIYETRIGRFYAYVRLISSLCHGASPERKKRSAALFPSPSHRVSPTSRDVAFVRIKLSY